jgi:hypothetical protein
MLTNSEPTGATTVTVTCAVAVPPIPVAVSVYVVVDAGATDLVPFEETEPSP